MRNSKASNKSSFKYFKVRDAGGEYEGSQCRRHSQDERGQRTGSADPVPERMAWDPHPQIALDAEITRTRRNPHDEGNSLHGFMVYHFLSLASSHLIRTSASRMGRKGVFSSPISRVGILRSKLVKRQEPSAKLNLC